MLRKASIPILALVALVACGNELPVGPSPIPLPSTTTTSIPVPTPNPGRGPVVFEEVVGVLSFALAHPPDGMGPEDHYWFIFNYCKKCLAANYNTLSVGSETEIWPGGGHYLRRGPKALTPEWEANLLRMLDATRDAGCWVQLIPVLTIKELNFKYQVKVTKRVIELTQNYDHIYYEAINEWRAHSDNTKSQVKDLLRLLRATGKPVTLGTGGLDYGKDESLLALLDIPSFHPERNPNPTVPELKRCKRKYGLALLSETCCYATEFEVATYNRYGDCRLYLCGKGTDAEFQAAAIEYMNRVREANNGRGALRWFFHHLAGLRCDSLDFWLPTWIGG